MKRLAVAFILLASAIISFGQAVGGNGVPGANSGGSGDTITSPNSTVNVGGTATATTLDVNLAAKNTWTASGAASAPAITFSGSPAIGSGTTAFPYFYLNAGTAPTTWGTSGTYLGMNAPSGFTGNFLDFHLNGGASVYSVGIGGAVTHSGDDNVGGNINANGSVVNWGANVTAYGGLGSGILRLTNNATTSFTRLDFGGTTSSFVALCTSGTTLTVCGADGSNVGLLASPGYGQHAASDTGGTCSMVTGTTCTITIGHTYTTPVCAATEQGTGATVIAAACGVTGTTVTITAASSNSATWGAFVFGNPN